MDTALEHIRSRPDRFLSPRFDGCFYQVEEQSDHLRVMLVPREPARRVSENEVEIITGHLPTICLTKKDLEPMRCRPD